uniref:ATP-dependent DNA helicase RecG n=1 Tax=candidate division WOR-3 bacterium TaxID=2052148 RepID=A0A7C6ECS8_UNCW3
MKSSRSKDYRTGLATPVQYLKGVGPKRAACLIRIGVETVKDLLFLIPRYYLDRTKLTPIKQLQVGQDATVVGKIFATGLKKTRFKGDLVRIMVRDDTGFIEAIWFNRPDLKKRFKVNQKIALSGKVYYYQSRQLVNPDYEIIEDAKEDYDYAGTIIPIYPLTEGLSLWEVRRAMKKALELGLPYLTETLPDEILNRYHFPPLSETIKNLHFPCQMADAEIAKARLIFEELFFFELLLALRKLHSAEIKKGYALVEKGVLTNKFLASLPFEFTNAQKRVVEEIKNDLAQSRCMNRLLQGDVGSGKTVIAVLAMLIAVENGFQAAMMAPTEILAEQHYLVWQKRLEALGVRVCLLTGGLKAKEKKALYPKIAQGEIDIIFGTHALIEAGVQFNRLGLAVVDEQHRFGVMQRAALLNKGVNPDFLVMTATPIPRTLQLTLYGDLDVSILDEKPPGRKPIVTKLTTESKRSEVYQFLRERVKSKQQVFIVCPLIEESEKLDLASAKKTYEEIRAVFPEFSVGLLHGRMKSEERIKVMAEFRAGRIDILVSTTVIEVGVDIPNATVMVIEHPERFGLAQLHQLRGRIGRGEEESYCILIVPDAMMAESKERLEFFEKNDDGFALAEKDMDIRGPGQIFGTRQHGLPDLKIADLKQDRHWLFKARDEAFALVRDDPKLTAPKNEIIKRTLRKKFYGREELLRVG